MNLEEFYDYKNQLVGDIVTSPEIVSLLNDSIDPNDIEAAKSLIYTQVFPHEYVPETVVEAATFVCCDVDIRKATVKPYLEATLYVWVFTHKSLLRLPEGGVRTDKLAAKIAEKINGSMYYGLGELDLYSAKRFAPMTDYNGKVLAFYTTDISRLHNPNKKVPSNRKRDNGNN